MKFFVKISFKFQFFCTNQVTFKSSFRLRFLWCAKFSAVVFSYAEYHGASTETLFDQMDIHCGKWLDAMKKEIKNLRPGDRGDAIIQLAEGTYRHQFERSAFESMLDELVVILMVQVEEKIGKYFGYLARCEGIARG